MHITNVYWVAKYTQLWENDIHSHNYFQILFMIGGKGNVNIDGETFEIKKGTVFIIPPTTNHAIICEGTDSKHFPKILDIKFDINNEDIKSDLLKLPYNNEIDNFDYFQLKLENLIKELQRQDKYCTEVVNMSFSVTLIKLMRSCKGEKINAQITYDQLEGLDIQLKGVDATELLDFIHQNFDKIISLNDLVKLGNTNKTTLTHIFKELYGTTPIRYINDLRMRKAKDLLVNSNISISEISELVGLQSIHYFSRKFKEMEGCSPLQYRMNHQGSRFITVDYATKFSHDKS
ncbi:MAG: helix-turn-helix transcriptional regulator [Epulopiscium sp.]|nr:helix-turn-helix transcriptional regulator [Candidatus Epulonipiscium sp.]